MSRPFDSTASLWAKHWAALAAPAREKLLEDLRPGERLLDVGCGSGELLDSRGLAVGGCVQFGRCAVAVGGWRGW